MLSPVPSSYHFVALILPAVLAADVFVKKRQHGHLAILVLLYFLMCGEIVTLQKVGTAFSFMMVLAFSRLWFGLALWLFLVLCLWRENRLEESHKAVALRALQLAVILCAFWIVAFSSYQRHFAYRAEDIRARLPLPAHPYLATSVHPTANGLIATLMVPTGYQIADQSGQAVQPGSTPDQLSSAAARTSSTHRSGDGGRKRLAHHIQERSCSRDLERRVSGDFRRWIVAGIHS